MADKEKIYIGIINPKGDFCPVPYGQCNSLCDYCTGGITRQEAIEVMAKAICRQDNLLESCKQCLTQCDKQKQKNMCEHILKKRKDNIEPSYFDKAETALNALLEKDNEFIKHLIGFILFALLLPFITVGYILWWNFCLDIMGR